MRIKGEPSYIEALRSTELVSNVEDPAADLYALLGEPNIASKDWLFRQYDYNVRHGTVLRPGQGDAGMVRVLAPDGRQKGVAISCSGNSRLVYLDPFEGTRRTVYEAYANLCATGATPLAVTNCLNFGNPEKPGIMWQFAEAVRGIGAACRELDTPVVSGNVSLYNETEGQAIKPTPMIAMVGLLDDAEQRVSMAFAPDMRIAVVGPLEGSLAGSEWSRAIHGAVGGAVLPPDASAIASCNFVRDQRAHLAACHDISEGGLLVALAECAIQGGVGFDADLGDAAGAEVLFGEGAGRFVIAVAPEQEASVAEAASAAGVDVSFIGRSGGDELVIRSASGTSRVWLADARSRFSNGFRDVANR